MLVSYIYDYAGGKRPIGCVVARKTNKGDIKIGFSICNPKDRFDKKQAQILAMKDVSPVVPNRQITKSEGNRVRLSEAIKDAIERMKQRVADYYKPYTVDDKWVRIKVGNYEAVGTVNPYDGIYDFWFDGYDLKAGDFTSYPVYQSEILEVYGKCK